jgi:lambda family phage portal protein
MVMATNPILHRVYGWIYGNPTGPDSPEAPALPIITPDMMSSAGNAPVRNRFHDGEKYPGGFGPTELLTADYWTLRARSTQLFKTNLYARGMLRRLVTNIINTGLSLEAVPDEGILGTNTDVLADWAESVENRFHLWETTPSLCDYKGMLSYGGLQATTKLAALISGDVLVVLLQDPATGLPRLRLVDGNRVQSPFGGTAGEPALRAGHYIRHGVELDADGRHVAYWIVTDNAVKPERRVERLARVDAAGRRQAWLVYGTDMLLDDVRGEPILSIMLLSLREIDRYRDAVQRKAAINAILAMFVTKDTEVMGSRPLAGGAVVRGKDSVASAIGGKPARTFNFAEMVPGAVLDELAPGEKPMGFPPTGTDEKFADFEAAIVYSMAWVLEFPPEIMTLSFKNNYSASQAAVNELKLYLNKVRATWGDEFCQPIYEQWLLSEVLAGRIRALGLLESWRDPSLYDRYAAWIAADWTGAIKPSIDLVKQANGYKMLVAEGFITRDRATRETTGTKYSKNVAKLLRENVALAAANKPIVELENPAPPAAAPTKRDLKIVPKGT